MERLKSEVFVNVTQLEYLVKCNSCDAVLYDENPKPDAVKIDISTIAGEILPMEQLNDGETFWGCGNCQTDEFLTDI